MAGKDKARQRLILIIRYLKEYGENGEKMHWCWVESWTEKFLSFDFVDRLWGTNKAKSLRGASEERLNQ